VAIVWRRRREKKLEKVKKTIFKNIKIEKKP
jgi:hypothetical protein